jgi:flagellar L-ring protein precursor FlgH
VNFRRAAPLNFWRAAPLNFWRAAPLNFWRAAPLLALILLPGCDVLTELSNVGRAPPLTPITSPTAAPNYRPVTMPMPEAGDLPQSPDSLWQSNARAFFKDQRASRVGDILTILVSINDDATLKNDTSAARTGTDSLGIPNLFGIETILPKIFGKSVSPSALVSATGAGSSTGTGQIQRNEAVTLSLAGEITQILPNGNLVVAARQEMEVNSELRVLQVAGIIRPEDITSDNTVASDQMAEARIGYGGTGTISNMQSPRVGQQIVDAIMPY